LPGVNYVAQMKGDIRMLRLRDREHAWVDINTSIVNVSRK
jgi:hypothetical protein